MDCLQTSIKEHFGEYLLVHQTEFDLNPNMTLTGKVKLLNLAEIADIDRFY